MAAFRDLPPYRRILWMTSLATVLVLVAAWFGYKQFYTSGTATDGHHQIIGECGLCHAPWTGATDARCVACHSGHDVETSDAHTLAVIREHARRLDPGAVRAAEQGCRACHREHRAGMTDAAGVTAADTFCQACHPRIIQRRASHADVSYRMCRGCHNYHDSHMLSEEFLHAHRGDPHTWPEPRVPLRADTAPAAVPEPDAPDAWLGDVDAVGEWQASRHAREGVNCSGCHVADTGGGTWSETVPLAVCEGCHEAQVAGFGRARHGMRIAAGLTPMRVRDARLPMRPEAMGRSMDCHACHGAHAYDTRLAAAGACIDCHAGRHVESWADSPHGELWRAEIRGEAPPGSGVSCATCHMPRVEDSASGRVVPRHDSNANLRPNQLMVTSVCTHCHGVRFSLNALADPEQVDAGFRVPPVVRDHSIRRRLEAGSRPSGGDDR